MNPSFSLGDRARFYAEAFPQFPSSHLTVEQPSAPGWGFVGTNPRWLTGHWILGNNYRGSGYYGCLAPSAKVLTADLRWVAHDTIKAGDWLVGVTEHPATSKTRRKRQLLPSQVQLIGEVQLPSRRILTDDGKDIIASDDHLWLVLDQGDGQARWKRTDLLKAGDRIRKVVDPWPAPDPFLSGWLAGILDGEGCVESGSGYRLSLTQNPGPVLDAARDLIAAFGIGATTSPQKRGRSRTSDIRTHNTAAALRLLGMAPSLRFKGTWDGIGLPVKAGYVFSTVSHVIGVGTQALIGMQTSTRTFVAEGLVSHNSFPPGLLARAMALFPDAEQVCHLFSGSLTAGPYTRVDLMPFVCPTPGWTSGFSEGALLTRLDADPREGLPLEMLRSIQRLWDQDGYLQADAHQLSLFIPPRSFDLIIADPPYTQADGERYGTGAVDRRKVLQQCYEVLTPGGFLLWLDTKLPIYRKDRWAWVGAISVIRSTNHRFRELVIFQRQGSPQPLLSIFPRGAAVQGLPATASRVEVPVASEVVL